MSAWRKQSRRWGYLPLARASLAVGRGEPVSPGVGRPCSVGIWSERVEAVGGGRSHYLDACGRLGKRDERTRKALRCISRSLVSARAVHHRGSRWRRPAAGRGGYTDRSFVQNKHERTLEMVNG